MSVTRLKCLSPAKLNLFLHVTGQRNNGYHDIQTLFQLLDWGDVMTFEKNSVPGIHLREHLPGVSKADNLIIRAAKLLLPKDAPGVTIGLEKNLPMGGGLGGGSSNAATTLLALNQLLELGYTTRQLMDIGLQLGADVPVFVRGRTAWAEGLGERLTSIDMPPRWYVVLRPACHVSTADIFSAPELTRNTTPITMSAFFAGGVRNDLQNVVVERHPEVRYALEMLEQSAPAMMTGSGACVFASVETERAAQAIADTAPAEMGAVVAEGVNQRPAFLLSHD